MHWIHDLVSDNGKLSAQIISAELILVNQLYVLYLLVPHIKMLDYYRFKN